MGGLAGPPEASGSLPEWFQDGRCYSGIRIQTGNFHGWSVFSSEGPRGARHLTEQDYTTWSRVSHTKPEELEFI